MNDILESIERERRKNAAELILLRARMNPYASAEEQGRQAAAAILLKSLVGNWEDIVLKAAEEFVSPADALEKALQDRCADVQAVIARMKERMEQEKAHRTIVQADVRRALGR